MILVRIIPLMGQDNVRIDALSQLLKPNLYPLSLLRKKAIAEVQNVDGFAGRISQKIGCGCFLSTHQ